MYNTGIFSAFRRGKSKLKKWRHVFRTVPQKQTTFPAINTLSCPRIHFESWLCCPRPQVGSLARQLSSDSSSASRSQVKKAVTDLRATPLPCCSAGSLLVSHL